MKRLNVKNLDINDTDTSRGNMWNNRKISSQNIGKESRR